MADEKWMAEGWSELGQREISGSRDNDRIAAFIREVGHSRHARDETPWCAAFVGACLERAGYSSTRSLMARSYLTWGQPTQRPQLGAIAVLTRGGNPAHGHVGFVVGSDNARIWLLGGNQSNSVNVTSFARQRLLGCRWPVEVDATSDDVFERALLHVLKMEGGYTNDPVDPGGPTNKGITLAVFAKFKGERVRPDNRSQLISELKSIDAASLASIYRRGYWDKADCIQMPPALALMHFDTAVNHGVTGAARILQEAVSVEVDGEIGPKTLAGVRKMPILELIRIYARVREGKYRSMSHFWRFGKGWLNRVRKTVKAAEGLDAAMGRDRQSVQREANLNAEFKERDMETISRDTEAGGSGNPELKWWGRSMTIWGALITAAATVLPTIGPLLGLDVSEAFIRELGQEVVRVAQAMAGLLGTMMTIYGRVRADQPLRLAR